MNALTKEFTDAIEKQLSKLDKDVQDALTKARTIECAMQDLEQKEASRHHHGGRRSRESWGQQVAQSEQVKTLAGIKDSQPGRVKVELNKKDIFGASDSGGALAPTARDNEVNRLPGARPMVRDLLTVINTESGSVEYVDQTLRDNQAAPQVEGALKAESNYAFDLKTANIRTLAHWTKASVQVLDDAPQLASIIDEELRYGLALLEDQQLLFGSGTGVNLSGIVTNAAAYSPAFTPTDETAIDKIGLAMLQVGLEHYIPNGVIMNPADWMRMRLLKNADGEYLLGDPQKDPAAGLFGLPVVVTTAMPIDSFLVGDFRAAARMYDRQSPTVQLSTEDGDNFIRNMVTIRAEERIGLAVKNAKALSYGDFGNVA